MRRFFCAAALVLMAGLLAAAQDPASPPQAPADEHPKLPAGQGRELMIHVCSPCHSPDSAADQDLDAAGWKSLVDEMAGKGADATDEQLDEIVHYLAAAFPPSK
jgi:mono/diheme cytochrome c family protein